MGKGDKKSRRGKIIRGSFGVRRRKKSGRPAIPASASAAVNAVEETVATPQASPEKKPGPTRAARPAGASVRKTTKPATAKTVKASKDTAAKPAPKEKKAAAGKAE